MKIGFVSDINPYTDRRSWSGTIYKLRESIENAGYQIIWIKFDKNLNDFRSRINLKLLTWYIKYTKKNVIGTCYLGFFCRYFAKVIERQGVYKNCDCLFFAGPSGGQIALYLKTKIPYIYLADASYHLMENYYWFNLGAFYAKKAKKEEEEATRQAWINIRSSQWAAEGAIKYCKATKETLYVLEFGANLEEKDIIITKPYSEGTLHIIFSGTDWERKGGDIAVLTTQHLRQKGYSAILHIVGIKEIPPIYNNLEFIDNIGFLDKNNVNDYEKYINMWKSVHILLLPTRAECSAIVFCEAAAYGIPVFTYDTGGTGNYVIDGVNGYKLQLSENHIAFADKIISCINNNQMKNLAQGARSLYEKKLSWKKWSERFKEIVESNKNAIYHL